MAFRRSRGRRRPAFKRFRRRRARRIRSYGSSRGGIRL